MRPIFVERLFSLKMKWPDITVCVQLSFLAACVVGESVRLRVPPAAKNIYGPSHVWLWPLMPRRMHGTRTCSTAEQGTTTRAKWNHTESCSCSCSKNLLKICLCRGTKIYTPKRSIGTICLSTIRVGLPPQERVLVRLCLLSCPFELNRRSEGGNFQVLIAPPSTVSFLLLSVGVCT